MIVALLTNPKYFFIVVVLVNSGETTDPRSPSMSIHGGGGSGGGGMSENLDLLVDYWPLQSSSTMQIANTKEKKEVNKVGLVSMTECFEFSMV